jgi:hypothetical protein
MNRYQQILAAALAVQIVIIAVVFWPRQTAIGAGAPIFPDLVTEDVVALTITDQDGNHMELRKEPDGWVLPEADGFPADAETITPVLEQVSNLTSSRLVTRTSASHKRLQVAADDFVRRIDFETSDGTVYTIFIGSSPQYGATHFRVQGQDDTYLTAGFSTWETRAEADAWIDATYVDLVASEVEKMTLENSSGSFTFTKDEENDWLMEGLAAEETLDQTKVNDVVRRAASINMERPLGREEQPEYGMDGPSAVVELQTAETTVTIRVGAQDTEDGSYTVISSESPYYVQVASYGVQDLVETTREDFLEMPPTPTPGGEAAPTSTGG